MKAGLFLCLLAFMACEKDIIDIGKCIYKAPKVQELINDAMVAIVTKDYSKLLQKIKESLPELIRIILGCATNFTAAEDQPKLEATEEPNNAFYTLRDFSKALEFTLISEGFLHNQTLYDDAIILKVRLSSILNSFVGSFFDVDKYITTDQYIASLVLNDDNKKAQIININLEDIDDTYAKIIVKIMSRFFFEFAKKRPERASIPFHLFLEEAHRYVSKDADTFLIGYNIFERIAKEGRKYGVLLNIISQRPVEISETVISQCSNFLIFKMTHPKDIEYIRTMLPNISQDVIEKQKILQPGNCVGFGGAFKLPMIIKLDKPNPAPYSQSCNVDHVWPLKGQTNQVATSNTVQNPNTTGINTATNVNTTMSNVAETL